MSGGIEAKVEQDVLMKLYLFLGIVVVFTINLYSKNR